MPNNLSEQISDLVYKIDIAHVNSPSAILWLEKITELLENNELPINIQRALEMNKALMSDEVS
ncbi:hypothetical protein [Chamaesiphon polymorphus]|uniref:Uncharacterized protein n=1 Tax=Chamaesiphon polymorphus CCALA 037 TaxID=2107692 RepID=A0A2T1FIF0_9CYAN|nr:hypothetical protein [Chamaesiphon polymorphus]PSB44767.1 hypothetical protein C7B77_25485 [Chamaesiphon polymorphus CCALA 037]